MLLLPPGADDVITLAGTGIAIWELLDTWRTVEALTELLAPHYEADPAIVRADVGALVASLAELGALELAADSGGSPAG
jgi:hypothetical protein